MEVFYSPLNPKFKGILKSYRFFILAVGLISSLPFLLPVSSE
jgi:hypothetical protein